MVATSLSSLYERIPLKTLPPSIGNAGIILNTHIITFTENNSIDKGTFSKISGIDIADNKRFVSGPASAINISDLLVRLFILIIAIPPNG